MGQQRVLVAYLEGGCRRAYRLQVAASLLGLVAVGCSNDSNTATLPPAPPAPPPQLAPAQSSPVVRNKSSKPAAKPKPKQTVEFVEPNTYSVGIASPNFEVQRPEFPLNSIAYIAMAPAEGSDLNEFVATAPRRPQPRTTVNPKFEVPAGFEIVAEGGFDEQGIPRRLRCTADSMEMAFVPAGTFLLGIDGRSLEVGPQHAVFVDGFYMDVLEVSLKQYELFRVATLTTRKPATAVNPFDPPDFPALGISWRDAQNYAKWAGKELPTEAEWEYAARGTEGFEYPWGNGRPIWEADRRPGQIEPVGSHPNDRSLFGIMDMAGSAREWCADWYAPDTYLQAKTPDGSPPRNPLGAERPSIPNARVLKGAGASGWQLWARSYAAMKDQLPDVAVRCVLRVKLPVEDVAAPLVAPAVP